MIFTTELTIEYFSNRLTRQHTRYTYPTDRGLLRTSRKLVFKDEIEILLF